MRGGLHTADHKGGASPVQEAEGASAAGDRTEILRFPVSEQEDPVAERCADHRQRVFSALLSPHGTSCPWAPTLHGRTSVVFLR